MSLGFRTTGSKDFPVSLALFSDGSIPNQSRIVGVKSIVDASASVYCVKKGSKCFIFLLKGGGNRQTFNDMIE